MARKYILIVDDEEDILELVRYNLEKAGYTCACVTSGKEVLTTALATLPDLVVLDLMLPGMNGLEVCAQMKNDPKTWSIPIVMLTARGSEADVVRGLETGADDYVTKPFSPKILIARVAAVLRRQPKDSHSEASPVRIRELLIHPGRREVLLEGASIELTPGEFGVLQFLAHRPGWVFTRSQIVDAIHGPGYPVTDRSVDVHIVGLRKKLGKYGDYIATVRGVGYRFKE